jgi:flavin-dependent dehydrogenase
MGISGPSAHFDLIVVGASFAGLVCARTAAMRGLRVAVIDRKAEPGARVHTTGILVKEAADELDVPAELTRKVRGVRLYGPAMTAIDLSSPGYFFLATETAGLMRWLARQASLAGARCLFGQGFTGARYEGDLIRVDGLDLTTRYLIGADGARSTVAACFGLGRNRAFLVGAEAHYAGDCGLDTNVLHCLLDRRLAPGYIAWLVPGPRVTQVGLACSQGHKPDLPGLIQKAASISSLSGAEPVERRSGLIPVGGLVRPFATHGVLLVGDAAGLVSPLTAGGIHNAFHFGRRAAQVVSDHLFDRGPEPSRVLATEYPKYRVKSALRRLMNLGPPDWAFDLALETRPMAAIARQIYFHRRSPVTDKHPSKYFKPRPQLHAAETSGQ